MSARKTAAVPVSYPHFLKVEARYDKRGKVIEPNISLAGAYRIKGYLEKEGFARLLDGNRRTSGWVLVQRVGAIVREVDGDYVRDLMLRKAIDANVPDEVLDGIVKWSEFGKVEALLPALSHDGLAPASSSFATMRDSPGEARFAFRNGVVVVGSNGVALRPHDPSLGVLWEHDILQRDAVVQLPRRTGGLFERFCELAFRVPVRTGSADWRDDFELTPEQEQHYRAFRACLGYLLHTHKDRANARAVIFLDIDSDDTKAQGGSGKSLTLEACGNLREMVVQDAQKYQSNRQSGGRFQFADVSADTKLVLLNDATKLFDFQELFNAVTGDFQVERKNENKWRIPFARAPKICISSNYVMPAEGASFTRRRYVVGFGSYWTECVRRGEHVTDARHLGKRLFDQFDDADWQDFDNYMFENVQLFLRDGVVEGSLVRIEDRAQRQRWGNEFVEWCADYFGGYDSRNVDPNDGESLDDLRMSFLSDHPGARPSDPTDFAQGLLEVGNLHGYDFNAHKADKGTTASQRRMRVRTGDRQVNHVIFCKVSTPTTQPNAATSPAQAPMGNPIDTTQPT